MGLRLWAADALGFAMAPTALPLALLHKQPTAAPGAALREAAPFVANLYIKVGWVGGCWGSFVSAAQQAETATQTLQLTSRSTCQGRACQRAVRKQANCAALVMLH